MLEAFVCCLLACFESYSRFPGTLEAEPSNLVQAIVIWASHEEIREVLLLFFHQSN